MTTFDGHVSLGDDRVPVTLEVEEEKVTLSSEGREIGIWGPEDVSIRYVGKGRYEISAENESLEFVPVDQDGFAIRFGGMDDRSAVTAPRRDGRHSGSTSASGDPEDEIILREAPPPRPATRVAFYGLAGVTAALGIWAVVSVFLG